MNKRTFSFGLIIIFTIILFYFLSTKTSLQLFVKTTKADGQSTSYGVDVINFNRPIGIKECDSTNPSASGSVQLKYTDKPYPNPDEQHTNPPVGSPSLFATKDNGVTWIDILNQNAGKVLIKKIPIRWASSNMPSQYIETGAIITQSYKSKLLGSINFNAQEDGVIQLTTNLSTYTYNYGSASTIGWVFAEIMNNSGQTQYFYICNSGLWLPSTTKFDYNNINLSALSFDGAKPSSSNDDIQGCSATNEGTDFFSIKKGNITVKIWLIPRISYSTFNQPNSNATLIYYPKSSLNSDSDVSPNIYPE